MFAMFENLVRHGPSERTIPVKVLAISEKDLGDPHGIPKAHVANPFRSDRKPLPGGELFQEDLFPAVPAGDEIIP